jgi:hypothetical protein
MKRVLFALILLSAVAQAAVPDQYPSSGEDLLGGLRIWTRVMAHKCSDGDCRHFTIEDVSKSIAAFGYLKGYVQGVRVTQIAGDRKLILFPKEGVDCQTLVAPLLKFLEGNSDARSQNASIGAFVFLKAHYPARN